MQSTERVYLDHAATTPVDGGVLNDMLPYFSELFGNSSSQHSFGRQTANAVTAARDKMAVALGISPAELYFTCGGTEADNLGIKGICLANADRGRHVVISAIEHPAVIESANDLKKYGFEVTFVNPDGRGVISPQAIADAMRQDTVLVAAMSANNETGVIQPIADIYSEVKARGAYLWCDCVQSAGVLPLSRFPADGYALSAHKFYGPKGAGAACIKKGVRFIRHMSGGHQERGMRGGTLNTPAIIGMSHALSLSLSRAAEDGERIARLRDEFERRVISQIDGTAVNGGGERLPSVTNISFDGCDGQNIVFLLDLNGVACSTGAACSSGATTPSHVLTAMGLDESRVRSAVRFSFGRNNTAADVDFAVEAIKKVVRAIRG